MRTVRALYAILMTRITPRANNRAWHVQVQDTTDAVQRKTPSETSDARRDDAHESENPPVCEATSNYKATLNYSHP